MQKIRNCRPNYFYKSYILETYPKLIKDVSLATKYNYSMYKFETTGCVNYFIEHVPEDFKDLDTLKATNDSEIIKECMRINNAYLHRVMRLKKRVNDIVLNGSLPCFLTLTFDNDKLEDTTEKNRRKRVCDFLRLVSTRFVANIDYGDNTGREHYHAIVDLKTYLNPKSNFWTSNYGFLSIEKVKADKSGSVVSLSKYISKLTNHAIKNSCKRVSLIYSR